VHSRLSLSTIRSSQGGNFRELFPETLPGFPGVVARLHIQPQFRTIATKLAQPHREIRTKRGSAAHHAMQRLPADAEHRRNLNNSAPAQRRQNVLREKHARMSRRPSNRFPIDKVFVAHFVRTQSSENLVILFQVYSSRAALFPLECDTPRPVNMDAVPLRLGVQWMKIEPRQIQLRETKGALQRIEASDAAGP